MKRLRLYHVIFGLSLACLAAQVLWWAVFMGRAVGVERQAGIAELRHRALEVALVLGHRPDVPTQADLPEDGLVEMAACGPEAQPGVVPAEPLHGELCMQPAAAAVQQIEDKLERRRAMVYGEGSFFGLLLCICTAMLFHLVRQERRHIRRMESFLHAVTHEMKTPLTGMKTLLETLAAGGVPDDVQPRLLELGLENADRLEHCIENMLVAGALRSGQHRLCVEVMALAPQLEAFLEHRRRTLAGRPEAVQLVWKPGAEAAMVRVDADMLRIVLENLVDNGLKYGGDEPVVELAVSTDGGMGLIAVSDGGVGFDRATAQRLFVPFSRGLSGGHGIAHGTGLGLAIARDLCRRMDGELSAHSDGPDRGSTFTVAIPLANKE